MSKYGKLTREQLIRELEGRDRDMAQIRGLWSTYEETSRRGTEYLAKFGHIVEVLEKWMDTPSVMRAKTGFSLEQFEYVLGFFEQYIRDHPESMPLYHIESERAGDPGSRCELSPRYALLMALVRKKTGATQESLAGDFGIDQATVSRYLDHADVILADILPTADNITDAARQRTVPPEAVFDDMLAFDGTHTEIQSPQDPEYQRMTFSGKKWTNTFNTLLGVNGAGLIVYASATHVGGSHDFHILKEEAGDLQEFLSSAPGKVHVYTDRGFLNIGEYLDIISHQPAKRSKNHPLTERQRRKNKKTSKRRITVEHSIGDVKSYRVLAVKYEGDIEKYRREFNIVTGLVNLRTMWKRIRRRGRPPWTGCLK